MDQRISIPLSATLDTWLRGYKTFFVLNSSEHKIYYARCWHFNIYQHDNENIWEFESKKLFIFQLVSFYEQLKFRTQLSWAWKKFYNLGPTRRSAQHAHYARA